MALKVFKFLFLIFLIQGCKSQNMVFDSSIIVYEIKFGDNFSDDSMNLKINDYPVFKDITLVSNKSYGLTNYWINISRKANFFFVNSSQNKEFKQIGLISDIIKLSIVYNDKITNFQINIKGGKYIVFSDDGKGNLIFNQSKVKPVFD